MNSQRPGSSANNGASSLKERLICTVCKKLLVDAVVLNECRHIYCRACLLGHLEYDDRCADCLTNLGPNKTAAFRPDLTLQELVYKLNPGHYYQEVRHRREFANRRHLDVVDRRMVLDKNFANLSRSIALEDERIPVNLVYRSPHAIGKPSTSENKRAAVATKVKVHLKAPASTTIAQLKRVMETKTDIPEPSFVTFVDNSENALLEESTTLQDLIFRHPISRKKPIRLIFTFLRQSPEEQEKPPVLDLMATQQAEQPPSLQWAEEDANLNKANVLDLNMSVTLSPSRLESCLMNNGEPAQKIININQRPVPQPPSQMPTLLPINGANALDLAQQKKRKKTLSPTKRSSDGELLPRASATLPAPPPSLVASTKNSPSQMTARSTPQTVQMNSNSVMPATTNAMQKYSQLQAIQLPMTSSVASTSAPVFVTFQNPPTSHTTQSRQTISSHSEFNGNAQQQQQQPIPIQPRPVTFLSAQKPAPNLNTHMLIPVNAQSLGPFMLGRTATVVGDSSNLFTSFRVPHIIAPNGNGQGMSYVFSMAPEIIRT